MKPRLDALTKGFQRFGVVAGVALLKLIEASPRLRAQFEILNLRINALVRVFGDELAPIIGRVADGIKGLIEWFNGLPAPIQEAIKFGGLVVIVLGLITIAVIALQAAASPLLLIILAIAAAAALLYLAWNENLFGIQEIAQQVFEALGPLIEIAIGNITDLIAIIIKLYEDSEPVLKLLEEAVTIYLGIITENFILFIEFVSGIAAILSAIFRGDIGAAFEALETLISGIVDTLVTKVKGFGKTLGNEFVKGVIEGIYALADKLEEATDFVASFMGGSLPERGGLQHIDEYGKELGETYVENIGTGLTAKGGDTFNRIFNIEKVEMTVPGATVEKTTSFLAQLETGMKKATRF